VLKRFSRGLACAAERTKGSAFDTGQIEQVIKKNIFFTPVNNTVQKEEKRELK
jgi:hypothetical protein